MQVEVKVTLAVPTIEVKLENGIVEHIDPILGLRAANVCIDPENPEAVPGLATVVNRFNALMKKTDVSSTLCPYVGWYARAMIESWWFGCIQGAIEDGTLIRTTIPIKLAGRI